MSQRCGVNISRAAPHTRLIDSLGIFPVRVISLLCRRHRQVGGKKSLIQPNQCEELRYFNNDYLSRFGALDRLAPKLSWIASGG